MTEKYLPPSNIPNTQVPRLNQEIYELLHRGVQIVDGNIQKVQHLQVAALSAILRIIEDYGNNLINISDQHLDMLTDANRMVTMTFSYNHQVRKDLVRNAIGYPIARYCQWDTEVETEHLFPNLNKRMEDREKARLNLRTGNRYR